MWHHPIEYQLRITALINRINIDKPDVLCLQEVTFPNEGANSAEILAKSTGMQIVSIYKQPNPSRTDGVSTGNAILSNLPLLEFESVVSGGDHVDIESNKSNGFIPLLPNFKRPVNSNAVYALLKTPSGNELLVISTHLSWGVFNEYQRLQESIDINNIAQSLIKNMPDALTVCGASMNATPESDSVRFMTGQLAIENSESYWVDCWRHCSTSEEGGETQTPRNVWDKYMAEENETFDTTKLPKRRIDYIFVRDWVFGQSGSPVTSKIAYGEPLGTGMRPDATVSDHFGVEAILYDLKK